VGRPRLGPRPSRRECRGHRRALAPGFSGSMHTLLWFITGLVLLWVCSAW
jgi:hypothetical protein